MNVLTDKKIDLAKAGLTAIQRSDPGSLQAKLYDALRSGIESNALPLDGLLPPERALSGFFDVSRITVTKVLDRLEQDGYLRREQGRGTFIERPRKRPAAIAFLAAAPAHPSLFKALMGMAPILNAAGSQLRVLGAFEGLGTEEEMLRRALDDGASGIIVYPENSIVAPKIYRSLDTLGVPLVAIDRVYPDLESDAVTYDDAGAAQALCTDLLAQGCRRIAVLPHREFAVSSVQGRIAGARQAAADLGLDPDAVVQVWRDVYADFSPSRPDETRDLAALMRLKTRLAQDGADAVFAINGDVAERMLYDLSSLAADLPWVNTLRLAACSHRPLATYGQFPVLTAMETADQLGEAAAKLLLDRINNPNAAHRHILVPMAIDIPER